jgi:hypothetical protein
MQGTMEMKKILSWSKNQYGTAVVTKEEDGTFKRHNFQLGKSDADIRAIVMGEPIPVTETKPVEPPAKRKQEKTIPEPPVVTKERITRQQMIDALDAAGVTDYDSRSRESLTMAFNALKKGVM